MPIVKQGTDGDYYIYRKNTNCSKSLLRSWYLVKYDYNTSKTGTLNLKKVNLPKELVGKKVRFKVEIMEE